MRLIVNADGAIVGRLGTVVAKTLLKGNEVVVINSEKAVISGNKAITIEEVRALKGRVGSGFRGPKVSRMPDRLLKKMITGMLPRQRPRGRFAEKRLRCYIGLGHGKYAIKEDEAKLAVNLNHKTPVKYMTLGELGRLI